MGVHSLGHVVLKVRNLERSVPFYRGFWIEAGWTAW